MVLIEISSVLRYLEISFACNNKLRQNRVKILISVTTIMTIGKKDRNGIIRFADSV